MAKKLNQTLKKGKNYHFEGEGREVRYIGERAVNAQRFHDFLYWLDHVGGTIVTLTIGSNNLLTKGARVDDFMQEYRKNFIGPKDPAYKGLSKLLIGGNV